MWVGVGVCVVVMKQRARRTFKKFPLSPLSLGPEAEMAAVEVKLEDVLVVTVAVEIAEIVGIAKFAQRPRRDRSMKSCQLTATVVKTVVYRP